MNGKKIISMLLAVVMVLQMIPGLTLPVSAVDGVTCTLTGEVLTISGSGTIESSDIPNPRYFTKVIIEEGVTAIGNYAFQGCSSLESVVIPSSVAEIGNYAFYSCNSLATVEYWGTEELTSPINAFSDTCVSFIDVHKDYNGKIFCGKSVNKTLSPAVKYSITIESVENGTVSADKVEAAEGATVTLTATPDTGYELERWSVIDATGSSVTVTNNEFTMPASDVTVTAVFKAASAPSTYQVTVSASEGGTVSGGGDIVQGNSVTITATANEGYHFVNWMKDGNSVSTDASYTFVPTENCKLIAMFEKIPHEHQWSYTAEGATLTANCSGVGTCDATNTTLTISASNSTYDGTKKEATLSASSIGDITALPAIQYQKQTGENTWSETTATAPTEAGTYKASLTVADKIISVVYTVGKKTIASVTIDVTAPAGGVAPDTDAGTGEGYSASEVAWSPSVSDKFAYNTIYTASVTLTAKRSERYHL